MGSTRVQWVFAWAISWLGVLVTGSAGSWFVAVSVVEGRPGATLGWFVATVAVASVQRALASVAGTRVW